jgi:class 3 adenylate cyclase
MGRMPAPMVDVLLAVMLLVAISIAIATGPSQGAEPDALAYGLGAAIALVSLFRRRWPLATLFASAILLFAYNQFDYPGLFAAVPLSISLATAWAAGHIGWSLANAIWFALTPFGFIVYQSLVEGRPMEEFLNRAIPDAALMGAVIFLGDALRSRRALEREQARSESLLLNVLPAPIAERLKDTDEVIADAYPWATVMFADLVDFTGRSERIAPEEMVRALDDLFSVFDDLARRHGLEKIKTIGDAYMAAAGVPVPRPDDADAVADLAIEMREAVTGRLDPEGRPLEVRIGIDTGPVVAGVIGKSKFIYDLWGDTVNSASRMESHGVPGRIQVTERLRQRLGDRYRFEPRGTIESREKGRWRPTSSSGRNSPPTPHQVGLRSTPRRNWALMATTIVERLISTAAAAGGSDTPAQARAPAASGMARTL